MKKPSGGRAADGKVQGSDSEFIIREVRTAKVLAADVDDDDDYYGICVMAFAKSSFSFSWALVSSVLTEASVFLSWPWKATYWSLWVLFTFSLISLMSLLKKSIYRFISLTIFSIAVT